MGINRLSTLAPPVWSSASLCEGKELPINLKDTKTTSSKKIDFNEQSSFLTWFTGFTDAEGNFLINLDRGYIRFRFKISMHIDNLPPVRDP
jgi:predicted ATPase